jgi:hypothetical protein
MKEDTDERVWALVGAQSILCTLFFLALLYLNFEIWHQYFFLILWAFVLSHAFKAGLDDLQEWAEHVSDSISKADRKRIICIFCVSMFRCDRDSNKNCCTLPSRVYKKLKNFAGSYGLYFLGGVYIVYWFKNHYIYTIMRRPRLIIWHLGYLSMFILLFFFLLIAFGGTNVSSCLRWCCGNPNSVVQKKEKKQLRQSSMKPSTVNSCATLLLITFSIASATILSSIMICHSIYDIASLSSIVYGEVNRSAHETAGRLNYTEHEFRVIVNGILDAPLSSARDNYENSTWWPIIEDVWKSVKRADKPFQIWSIAHNCTKNIYGNETWFPYVDPYFNTIQRWSSGGNGDGSNNEDGNNACDQMIEGESKEQCNNDFKNILSIEYSTTEKQKEVIRGQEEGISFATKVRESVWQPLLETYLWVSENNVTISNILKRTKDVGGDVLGGKYY